MEAELVQLRFYVLGPQLVAENAARHTAAAPSSPPRLLTPRPEIAHLPKKGPAVRSPAGRATSRTRSSGSTFGAGHDRIFVGALKCRRARESAEV